MWLTSITKRFLNCFINQNIKIQIILFLFMNNDKFYKIQSRVTDMHFFPSNSCFSTSRYPACSE